LRDATRVTAGGHTNVAVRNRLLVVLLRRPVVRVEVLLSLLPPLDLLSAVVDDVAVAVSLAVAAAATLRRLPVVVVVVLSATVRCCRDFVERHV
jgi:hypothetical protein